MKTKLIIFDLDGTLINSVADLTIAMNYALNEFGQPTHTPQDCTMMIGHGLRKFCANALAPNKQHLIDEVMASMLSYYKSNFLEHTFAYPDIMELLGQLQKMNIILAVETNKDEILATQIVHGIFGEECFCSIKGATNGIAIKPDPKVTNEIITQYGCNSDEVIFVGDSDVDIQTAQASQLRSVAVSWGLRTHQQLSAANPDYIINNPLELMDLLS